MGVAYRIRDWSQHFENNRTRELKYLDWVRVPNKMDGDGYTELTDHPNAAAHFGAWMAIVEIASRCDPRGTLLRDTAESRTHLRDGADGGAAGVKRAHTPQSLARISRLPAGSFEDVIPRLLSIGWLEVIEISQEGAVLESHPPAESCVSSADGTERNRRERSGAERSGSEVKRSGSERKGEGAPPLASLHASPPAAEGEKERGETWKGGCFYCGSEDDELEPDTFTQLRTGKTGGREGGQRTVLACAGCRALKSGLGFADPVAARGWISLRVRHAEKA